MTRPHPMVTALNRDWSALHDASAPMIRTWAAVHPALAGCTVLDDVLAAIRRSPDEVLALLLALGVSGADLAHRIVLQAMLGKAVLLARADPRHDVGDYLTELWLLIRSYPLSRRPRRIAANLALDCRKRLAARTGALPLDPDDLAAVAEPEPLEEPTAARVLAEAERLGLIDRSAIRTLRAVYCEGKPSRQTAAELGTSPDLVRWRCSRALRRLAQHADQLSCA